MKIYLNKLILILFLFIGVKEIAFGQPTPSPVVSGYTACPNQVITANVSWANVSAPNYSLYLAPLAGGPPILVTGGPTFTISSGATVTYVLVGAGIYQGGPLTQTINFVLTIQAPPPLVVSSDSGTNGFNGNYCNGATATITAQSGGFVYDYAGQGPGINGSSNSNVFTIGPLQQTNTGQFTVTSVISGCTLTGVTNIAVAPAVQITVNSPSNICQGGFVNLTANLPGGFNYDWFHNGAPYASAQNIVVPDPGTNPAGIMPSHGGTYSVTAYQPFNGISCPHVANTQINVVATSPVAVSASPSNYVCQGGNLSLSANAPGASPGGWVWQGPSFSSTSANPLIAPALPTHSGNYSVTASFVGAFLTCYTDAVITISVIPVSPPVITMSTNICQNDNLSVSSSVGPNAVSRLWSGPAFVGVAGTNQAAVTVPTIQPNASGTQFLSVTYQYLSSTVQCVSTSSAQLNVVPVNSISVIPPQPVCTPDNGFLQALATGAYMYSWTGPNGFSNTSPQGNAFIYYPTVNATGVYTVTAYFGNGNLVCSNFTTVPFTVNPVLNFGLDPYEKTCYNSTLAIAGPAGATSYTWTSSTGFTSNNKDLVFSSIQPNNAGTYTLNVSLGPCVTGDDTEIIVLDPVSYTLTPFDRTICRGDTIVLEVGATGGSQNYVYSWNPPLYLESLHEPKQVSVPLGSVVYNVLVHDVACPSFSLSHNFNITVKQPPVPRLELSQTEGCAPLCLFYNTKVQKESAIVTFDFGDNKMFQSPDTAGFRYCLPDAGIYNLKIYSKGKNGCSGTYNFPYPIIVNPKPGSDVSWTPEIPTTTDEITFYPTSSYEPVTYYSWSFKGGVAPGDTNSIKNIGATDTTNIKNPKRVYDSYGTYPVVLIATNDKSCTDTVVKFMKVIDDMQIFVPNSFTPNGDGINDEFKAKGTGMRVENFSMDIFNRAGLVVFSTKDINQGWDGKVGGQPVKDATYIYLIRVVGMNGEGRKEMTGQITVIK